MGEKKGPGECPPAPPGTGAHGGIVGTSYGLLASPQAAKLVPSTVPPLPTKPASLGFGGGPIMIISPGAAAPRAARIGITRQALVTAALHRVRPPGRRRCHASEIPEWPSRLPVGAHLCVRPHYMPPHIATACRAGACPRRPSSLLRKSPRPPEDSGGRGFASMGEVGHRKTAPSSFSSSSRTDFTSSSAAPRKRRFRGDPRLKLHGRNEFARYQGFGYAKTLGRADARAPLRGAPRRMRSHRKTAPNSFSSSSRTDFTSSSASAAVRERSSARRVRLKATLFLPSGMGAPV